MANPLLPDGRTTPIAAYIAVRDNSLFGNCNRVRGVSANNEAGPQNAAGVSGPKLGGSSGVTLQDIAHV